MGRASAKPPGTRSLVALLLVRPGRDREQVVALPVGDPARFGVLFLYEPVPTGRLDGFDGAALAPEVTHPADREIYFSLPNGFGRAKLPLAVHRRPKVPATIRNWRTVIILASLAVS